MYVFYIHVCVCTCIRVYVSTCVCVYRLGSGGCNQCTGSDDDADDFSYYGHNDDDTRRLMTNDISSGSSSGSSSSSASSSTSEYDYDSGYEGSFMIFNITAEVALDEDPVTVIEAIENDLNEYFSDGVTSCHTWVERTRALGGDLPDGYHIYFSDTEVKSDSVHVSKPGDYLTHHYSNNEAVRIGVWVSVVVASVALIATVKYGVSVYSNRQSSSEDCTSVATTVVDQESGVTMNPIAEVTSSDVGAL
jgi:hypothetical protein